MPEYVTTCAYTFLDGFRYQGTLTFFFCLFFFFKIRFLAVKGAEANL